VRRSYHIACYDGIVILLALSILQAQVQLPDAPNKKLVERLCNTCHSVGLAISQRRTQPAWSKSVDDMTGKGLKATDEELDAVVAYLTKYFGKLNVNTSTAEELANVLDITPKEAAAIVKFREDNGDFKTIDALTKVPGVDSAKLEAKRDRILLK
jgi:competence protein ComEA